MKIRIASLTLIILLLAASLTYSESAITVDHDHVTGSICVQGYEFAVDAVLDTPAVDADSIAYSKMAYDRPTAEQAIANAFPRYDSALPENLSYDHATLTAASPRFALPAEIYPATHPYSQMGLDQALQTALSSSLSFCKEIGLSVSSLPLSCSYFVLRTDGQMVRILPQETAAMDVPVFMEVWLALSEQGSSVVPELQVPHYNGTQVLTGSAALITQSPGARFYFDQSGVLLAFCASLLETDSSGGSVQDVLDWESALQLFLQDFTSSKQIQQLLQTTDYTVTSIRSAWDIAENNTGKHGWMITISARVPSEQSPTGWRNRHYTAFVYGGKQ